MRKLLIFVFLISIIIATATAFSYANQDKNHCSNSDKSSITACEDNKMQCERRQSRMNNCPIASENRKPCERQRSNMNNCPIMSGNRRPCEQQCSNMNNCPMMSENRKPCSRRYSNISSGDMQCNMDKSRMRRGHHRYEMKGFPLMKCLTRIDNDMPEELKEKAIELRKMKIDLQAEIQKRPVDKQKILELIGKIRMEHQGIMDWKINKYLDSLK